MFNANEDNSKVYQDLGFDIIEAAVSGFNSTIFAYGQTASGKTHTMMGDDQQKGKHFLMNFVTDFTLFLSHLYQVSIELYASFLESLTGMNNYENSEQKWVFLK